MQSPGGERKQSRGRAAQRMVPNPARLDLPPLVPGGAGAGAGAGDAPAPEPTVVEVCANLRSLAEFSAVTFTAEVDMELIWYWRDPRLRA